VNLPIFDSIFCDSDDESEEDSDDEAVESSKNNEKSPKEKVVVRVTENTKNDTYAFEISKKIVDSAIEKGPGLVVEGIKDVAPQIGIAAAAGKVAAETIKHTSGMAPVARLAAIGSAAIVTAAGTSLGLELGKAVANNIKKETEIEASKSGEISPDEPESPTKFDRDFIHSVLDDSEIPLIVMVNGLSSLNYIEFSLVLTLFSLLFRKILIRKLKDLIIKYIQKIKKTNKQKFQEVESIKDKDIDKKVSLNQAINTLDKYTNFIIVFIFICLF
jgi:hypothetical protein